MTQLGSLSILFCPLLQSASSARHLAVVRLSSLHPSINGVVSPLIFFLLLPYPYLPQDNFPHSFQPHVKPIQIFYSLKLLEYCSLDTDCLHFVVFFILLFLNQWPYTFRSTLLSKTISRLRSIIFLFSVCLMIGIHTKERGRSVFYIILTLSSRDTLLELSIVSSVQRLQFSAFNLAQISVSLKELLLFELVLRFLSSLLYTIANCDVSIMIYSPSNN